MTPLTFTLSTPPSSPLSRSPSLPFLPLFPVALALPPLLKQGVGGEGEGEEGKEEEEGHQKGEQKGKQEREEEKEREEEGEEGGGRDRGCILLCFWYQ